MLLYDLSDVFDLLVGRLSLCFKECFEQRLGVPFQCVFQIDYRIVGLLALVVQLL